MARGDTLIVLDCCNAGLAAVSAMGNEDHQDEGSHHGSSDSEDIYDDDNDSVGEWDNTADHENNPAGNHPPNGRPATEQHDNEVEPQAIGTDQQDVVDPQPDDLDPQPDDLDAQPDAVDAQQDVVDDRPDNVNRLEARKELIGACGWGVETSDHMSPSMCRVLKNRLRRLGSNMSTFRLVHEMNSILVKEYVRPPAGKVSEDIPQAVHYVLRHQQPASSRRVRAGKIVLPHI